MTRCVPDLQLHFAALVVLCSIVGIKDSGLVQGGEGLLCPRHDDGGLTHGGVAHEDQLHVVLLILVNERLVVVDYLYHY